ncbi:hypothetical protein OAH18_00705 [bacterium]|nr:hypothetical protein [bacterium]
MKSGGDLRFILAEPCKVSVTVRLQLTLTSSPAGTCAKVLDGRATKNTLAQMRPATVE